MARSTGRLNALAVTRAKAEGRYADGDGLYLRVSETGAKSWIYRYMLNGKVHEMGLGPLSAFTLAQARKRATECRNLKWAGNDPILARKAARVEARLEAARSITFEDAATAYVLAHKAAWKNEKHAAQWTSTLKA